VAASPLGDRLVVHPLIHDWNAERGRPRPRVLLNDETLRDGLQSPSVRTPDIDEKVDLLRRMAALGIDTANLGLPGAGPRVAADVEQLARAISAERLPIAANCAARTLEADIAPIVEISQRTGVAIECCTFIGSSPLRQYVEGWALEHLQRLTDEAISFAVRHGLSVMFVTEDTTRADPQSLTVLVRTALAAGASRLCLADTVGYATPAGAAAVVRFVGDLLKGLGVQVGLDWHGHQDRGLGLAAALSAIDAGVTRVHGTALGIGERAGNTPIDQLLVNLVLSGYDTRDLSTLPDYCEAVSRACDVPIPANYPVMGADAFRTATGVHAAAVLKASRTEDRALADVVYAAVPASLVGREQVIDIGPVSGRSNVIYWLERHGLSGTDELIERVLEAAKKSQRTLTSAEILAIVELCRAR